MKTAAIMLIALTVSVDAWAQELPDHKFYNDEGRTVVPFDLYKNQVFVPVQVNGSRPLWFILDTGANVAALDQTVAEELGLKPEGERTTQGVGSNGVQMKFLKNISFALPGLTFVDDQIITLDYKPNYAFQGRETDGIFSYDFLKRFVVTIDYARHQLIIEEPAVAAQGSSIPRSGEVFPLAFQSDLPYVTARITVPGNLPQTTTFLVDVGSGDSVDWPKLGISKGKLLNTVSGVGLGNNEEKGFTGLGMLRLGKFEFRRIPIHCCGGNVLGNHLIGGELLKRFAVTLDFPHQRMILIPTSDLSDPFPFDCSGLILRRDRDTKFFRIKTVISDSPASESGLETTDQIEQINGIPAAQWTLESLEGALMVPKRTFVLTVVNSQGATKTATLLTRALL